MNRKNLESALVNAPETKVKVSTGLHQNIMRAVRLAEPVSMKPASRRAGTAWAAGVLAVMIASVIFYLPQQGSVDPVLRNGTVQSMSQVELSTASLLNLEEGLLALSEETSTPEAELRKELERLKSDLARFDLRS